MREIKAADHTDPYIGALTQHGGARDVYYRSNR